MKIRYFGHSYFLIEGVEYSICLDPYGDIGLQQIKCKADYLFCSHEHYDHNNRKICEYKKEITNNFDNFEIINSYHDNEFGKLRGKNDILKFKLDGVVIAFLGDLGCFFDENLINKIKGVDILLIPVGGRYTIDHLIAYEYCKKIQPKTIIPMHYKILNSTVDIDSVDKFLSLFSDYKIAKSPYTFNYDSCVKIIEERSKI